MSLLRKRYAPSLLTCIAFLALLGAAPASAEVRAGSVYDPSEAPSDVNGRVLREDVIRVKAAYDTDGAAQVVLRLSQTVDEDSAARFVVGLGVTEPGGGCDSSAQGGISLDVGLVASSFTATVVGKVGRARGAVKRSPDGRTLYANVDAPGLRDLGLTCATHGFLYEKNDDYSEFCEPEFESCAPAVTELEDTDGFALHDGGVFDRPPLPAIPTLSKTDAAYYVGQALSQRFKGAYRYKSGYRRRCGRLSRVRVRCRVSWFVGDGVFSGKVTIWHARDRADPTQVNWNYAYTIRLLDEYCKYVTKGKNCTKTYRVK